MYTTLPSSFLSLQTIAPHRPLFTDALEISPLFSPVSVLSILPLLDLPSPWPIFSIHLSLYLTHTHEVTQWSPVHTLHHFRSTFQSNRRQPLSVFKSWFSVTSSEVARRTGCHSWSCCCIVSTCRAASSSFSRPFSNLSPMEVSSYCLAFTV